MSTGSSIGAMETDNESTAVCQEAGNGQKTLGIFLGEATFQHKVKGLKKMERGRSKLSSPCMIRGLPWKIMAKCGVAENGQKTLGFFLQCNAQSDSKSWSCNAEATFRMLSQEEGIPHYELKISHLFSPEENACGYSNFMLWADVINPAKGYIKCNAIILEVDVRADKPDGVQLITTLEDVPGESLRAELEKAAISYLDDFIDSQVKSKDKKDVPLVSFQEWISTTGPKEIRDYIGFTTQAVQDFISARRHLWQVWAPPNDDLNNVLVIEKQPEELRAAFVWMVTFVQTETRDGGDATVNSIASQLEQYFPSVRAEFGKGPEGVKSLLLRFPALFAAQPWYTKSCEPTNMNFKNRAVVIDDIILLSEQDCQENPYRMTGCGPIAMKCAKKGFIRDVQSNEEAFFTTTEVFRGHYGTFRRLVTDGREFHFQAILGSKYEKGKTKSKWFAIDMWAKDEGIEWNKSGTCSSRKGGSKCWWKTCGKGRETGGGKEVEKNEKTGSGKEVEKDEKTGGGKEVENAPAQNQLLNHGSRSMEDVIKVRKDELGEMDTATVNKASEMAKAEEDAKYLKRLEELEKFTLQSQSRIQELYDKMASVSSPTAPSTSAFVAPAQPPPPFWPPRQITCQERKRVQLSDAGCQTEEFNDERELLLRILRRSPDLLKLVRVFRQANA